MVRYGKVWRKQDGLHGNAWPWPGLGTGVDVKGALGPEMLEGEEAGEGGVMGVWGMDMAVWP